MIEKATFAAGCFWGVEAAFKKIDGVVSTIVGFMGGDVKDPSYELVCSNNTGHAEVVHIEFDSEKVSYEKLLEIFWKIHDPTQLNKQGADVGKQYRSVIFYHNERQKKIAEKSKEEIQKSFDKKIVTGIESAEDFYEAEEYHQDYYNKNKISSMLHRLMR